ncbi:MAG: hypothetical protein DI566_05085 [Microbacterium sp.]|nr:MAG: hypothetical protein DI566_05085 [Microbacterium sp.]
MTDRFAPPAGSDLEALVAHAIPLLGIGGGPMPEPFVPGADRARWQDEVALMRARHDSSALDAGRILQPILEAELGPDPLGVGDAPIEVRWAQVPVAGGAIGLRIYLPAAPASGARPVVALIHGGAYWMGGGSAGWQLNDTLCRRLCTGTDAVVVNIDHRLAPEHPYPEPLDDVVAALEWIVANAESLTADPERLALFGISSGGNFAVAAAHRALDGRAPAPAALVLQCASVNLSLESGRFEADPISVEGARRIIALYAGGADTTDPDVSPGLRPDLRGVPPTLVITADYDPLAADALHYADRLTEAGSAVTRHSYPMTHTVAVPRVFRRMHDDTVAWLTKTLHA